MFLFSSDKYPEVELLDHIVGLFKNVEEPPYCFPECLHWFIVLTVHNGSLYSTSSPTLISCLFHSSHSNRSEVLSHYSFDLHFPDD